LSEGPREKRSRLALIVDSPSAQNLSIAAMSPARPSALAGRRPRELLACSARKVSAAAMPEGKRSCSTLIICRFIGMAMVTPSTAIKNTQASMSGTDIEWRLMMM
jgi:hypothetical protein